MDKGGNISDNSENGIKDLKTPKTQNNIKHAMLTMLEEKSFDKISVNNLYEEALVSRSTFHVYFKEKYDLLESCMNDLKRDFEVFAVQHSDREIITEINNYKFQNYLKI